MTRFPFMLLVVGLACILVVVGYRDAKERPSLADGDVGSDRRTGESLLGLFGLLTLMAVTVAGLLLGPRPMSSSEPPAGLRETRIDLTPMQTGSRVRPCVSRNPTDNAAVRLGHVAQANGTLSWCR